jgi:hypothetical protein
VYFDFDTDLDAPMGFQISLTRLSDHMNPEPALGVEQSQQNNGTIEGTAKFNRQLMRLRSLHSSFQTGLLYIRE